MLVARFAVTMELYAIWRTPDTSTTGSAVRSVVIPRTALLAPAAQIPAIFEGPPTTLGGEREASNDGAARFSSVLRHHVDFEFDRTEVESERRESNTPSACPPRMQSIGRHARQPCGCVTSRTGP
jgi:hypothetical protein